MTELRERLRQYAYVHTGGGDVYVSMELMDAAVEHAITQSNDPDTAGALRDSFIAGAVFQNTQRDDRVDRVDRAVRRFLSDK